MNELTVQSMNVKTLREILSYDATTGNFTWKILTKNRKCTPGRPAGYSNHNGYWQITINSKHYKAHRLAWLYVFGKWPDGYLDHINNNGMDNRISNLRIAAPKQNAANSRRRRTNSSGFKGVSRHKKLWRAVICADGKSYLLGLFRSPEEAHVAYCSAAQKLFGEFWRAE